MYDTNVSVGKKVEGKESVVQRMYFLKLGQYPDIMLLEIKPLILLSKTNTNKQ